MDVDFGGEAGGAVEVVGCWKGGGGCCSVRWWRGAGFGNVIWHLGGLLVIVSIVESPQGDMFTAKVSPF